MTTKIPCRLTCLWQSKNLAHRQDTALGFLTST